MTTSAKLGIPYIASSQSQPEVTHNDAIAMIQVLLARGVLQRGLNTPPSTPINGDAYIVGTSPTGIWVGKDNCIAAYYQDQWYYVPGFDSSGTQITMGSDQIGLMVYSISESDFYVWAEDGGSPSTFSWQASGFGGATAGVDVEEDTVSVLANATILDFGGAGVSVVDAGGGRATITIPGSSGISGIEVSDGGSPEVVTSATAIDFTGAGVSVTNAGGGRATVDIPGGGGGGGGAIEVSDGGSPEIVAEATALDFVGDGVTVADGGGGRATITISGSAANPPYDLGVFFAGSPSNGQEIFRMKAVRGFTIPDGAVGSTANARVESTGSAVFSVRKNEVQFATITFSAGSPTDYDGAWAFDSAGDETFVAEDTLTIIAPSTADGTLADIGIFIKGTRTV
jgi:hypothetical protein